MSIPVKAGGAGARQIVCAFLCIFAAMQSQADPVGSVEFTADGFSVGENSGTAKVVLIRSSLFGDAFTVDYATHDGSALGNSDYIPTNGTIRFVPGQTNATIYIPILNDTDFEGLETFTVELSNPTAGATLGSKRTATVTIVDDESVTPGTLDADFNPGSGANGTVYAIQWQSGNSVIIGGAFTTVDGTARPALARLSSTGSLDATFAPQILNGETVYAIAQQLDGKLLVGGTFTSIGSTPCNRIARLLPTGALDPTFNPAAGAEGPVRTITLQADGKLIVGGQFARFNDAPHGGIVRLNSDGSIDPSFNANADGMVTCSLVQTDGKIFVGGSFHSVNTATRIYAARLNADGSVDQAFNPGSGNTVVNGTGIKTMALQSDGKLLIGADSSIMYGSGRIALNRLLENGDLDRTFNPNVPSGFSVLAVAVQADGHVIIGGDFNYLADPTCCDRYDRKGIARLSADGSVDTTFDPGGGVNPINVAALALQPDLKVLIGGGFTTYNSINRSGVARIHGDLRARIVSASYDGCMQITVTNQANRTYVIEASTNLTDWVPVATNSPSTKSFNYADTNTAVGPMRIYRIRELLQ